MTLNRPDALNALTHDMCRAIESALDRFEADATIKVIALQSAGDRAFCAGGDLEDLYASAKAGDYAFGQQFWTDEYRLVAKLATAPKPVVSFLQGYTLGGGVGIGCHVTHRIVCESSRIALPECALGIVPDVGGSLLLANASGRVGEYLGLTTQRMGPADAIVAGFADVFVPHHSWDALKEALSRTGDPTVLNESAESAPAGTLTIDKINQHFAGESLTDILNSLRSDPSEFAIQTLQHLSKPDPLAMATTVELIHRIRNAPDIIKALDLEYRFTFRAAEHGDFIEGIRALIIDKDKSPNWSHPLDAVPATKISQMLMPLGTDALNLTELS
ncbi:MAG: enoyl-CoA hydratase/isomerase family protein [Planktomarina sp.]